MGVSVNKPANAAESTNEIAEPAAPKTTSLELALYKRWVDNSEPSKPLYIAGTEYIFLEAVGTKMLQLHENGKPLFKRWKPKAPRRVVVQENEPVDMTRNATPAPAPGVATPSAHRIEIGADDELNSLMTDTDHDEDQGRDDDSAHEV